MLIGNVNYSWEYDSNVSLIENGILKIDGVTMCVVNFMTQKMVFDAEDAVYDAAFTEAKKVIKKVDSDIVIKEK